MSVQPLRGGLRERRGDETEVRPVELFFDLVYVLAVTQVTHYLLEHLSLRGMGETLILFLIVWLGWIHMVWITNYFHLGTLAVRFVLLAVMLAGLIMSASLPEAFGDRGLAFAFAVVAILVGTTALLPFAIGRRHRLTRVFERVLVWWSAVGVLLLVGALVEGDARVAIWLAAAALAYAVMWKGFPVRDACCGGSGPAGAQRLHLPPRADGDRDRRSRRRRRACHRPSG